jgi:hypothetical protein
MNDMKEFMNLVLNVAFNQMHLYKQSQYAKSRYQELFKDEIEDAAEFADKIRNYFDEFIHQTYQADGSALSEDEVRSISE